MDAAHQIAEFRQGGAGAGLRLGQQRLGIGRIGLDGLLGHAEVHLQRNQSHLRAVMQVPFEAAEFDRGGVDGGGPGRGQLIHPDRKPGGGGRGEQPARQLGLTGDQVSREAVGHDHQQGTDRDQQPRSLGRTGR